MTKVLADKSFLAYQREMIDTIRDILRWRPITDVNFRCSPVPVLDQPPLLVPPTINMIDLDLPPGQIPNHILIATSDDFGIENVYVRIRNEEGNLIESGDAVPRLETPGVWHDISTTRVPSGTTLTIYVTAIDSLGAVGASSVHLTTC